MGYEWIVHGLTFLILVSYRGDSARYRRGVSFLAATLAGLSFAATFYTWAFPAPLPLTVAGVILFLAVARCRGNVAKLLRTFNHAQPARRH